MTAAEQPPNPDFSEAERAFSDYLKNHDEISQPDQSVTELNAAHDAVLEGRQSFLSSFAAYCEKPTLENANLMNTGCSAYASAFSSYLATLLSQLEDTAHPEEALEISAINTLAEDSARIEAMQPFINAPLSEIEPDILRSGLQDAIDSAPERLLKLVLSDVSAQLLGKSIATDVEMTSASIVDKYHNSSAVKRQEWIRKAGQYTRDIGKIALGTAIGTTIALLINRYTKN